jgi:uncharacterized protein
LKKIIISPIALITGASSGIGWELAKLFAADGYDLVLVARNVDRLNQLAGDLSSKFGVTCHVMPTDLASHEERLALFRQLQDRKITIDVLVNNAGFGVFSPFYDTPLARQLEMIEVNITALTHLTHLFLPGMVKRGSGKILNIASTAGFQPGPFMAVYYATKAYVISFTEAIRSEVDGTGVSVTTFCPGVTKTQFHEIAGIEKVSPAGFLLMSAEKAARIAYHGMEKNRGVVISGWKNRIIITITRHAPRGFVRFIMKTLQNSRR